MRLLRDWKTPNISAYAYYPMGRDTRAAARAFIDYLVTALSTDPAHALRD